MTRSARPLSLATCSVALLLTSFLRASDTQPAQSQPTTTMGDRQVAVQFDGGYDTDPHDRGRPVILIANALNVTPEVFRAAFDHVKPAGPNSGGPTPAEARQNKRALLDALSKYGVTNDRLDEVSNYYRYNRSAGEVWKRSPAKATAILHDGAVTAITVTDPGSGYTSVPTIHIDGTIMKATAAVQYNTDFRTNGSIKTITLDK